MAQIGILIETIVRRREAQVRHPPSWTECCVWPTSVDRCQEQASCV